MGDRANIVVKDGKGGELWMYGHWLGHAMPTILRDALVRGKERWSDGAYLARVIFCEMVQGDVMGVTGIGLTIYMGDGGGNVLRVDTKQQTVHRGERSWSFSEYAALSDADVEVL